MYKEIVINVSQRETRVALLEDGTIVELFIERGDDADITGNIYKGRVQRVLPGIQAAFVDIGLNQAAFIYVDDVLRNGFQDIEKQMAQSEGYDAPYPPVPEDHRQSPIEELLVEGQEILVHVAKAPMGTKGPRVTSYLSLPGRFLVLMPFANHIGVSRRIEDEAERSRLKNMIAEMRDNHFGYIVRRRDRHSPGPAGNAVSQKSLGQRPEKIQKRPGPDPYPPGTFTQPAGGPRSSGA